MHDEVAVSIMGRVWGWLNTPHYSNLSELQEDTELRIARFQAAAGGLQPSTQVEQRY